jgi:hypothetical protein
VGAGNHTTAAMPLIEPVSLISYFERLLFWQPPPLASASVGEAVARGPASVGQLGKADGGVGDSDSCGPNVHSHSRVRQLYFFKSALDKDVVPTVYRTEVTYNDGTSPSQRGNIRGVMLYRLHVGTGVAGQAVSRRASSRAGGQQ